MRRMDLHRMILGTTGPPQRPAVLPAAPDGGAPITGRAGLQKMAFLLSGMSDGTAGRCGCGAGGRGPHSWIACEAARRLEEIGALRFDRGDALITPAARRVAEEIAEGGDGGALGAVGGCRDMPDGLPGGEALGYARLLCPRMAGRPAGRDRIKRCMERHVMSMLKKKRIGSGRAAGPLGARLGYVLGRARGMRAPAQG